MIVITGIHGLLGFDFLRYFKMNNIEFIGLSRKELDFTDEIATLEMMRQIKPDCIIHCGAYSNVDLAETEKEVCYRANVEGTKNIVKACKRYHAKLLYFSSDYVFDGEKDGFYAEEDLKNPLSVYGKTKADAEDIVVQQLERYFIIRTSWLFGINGKNFVDTIIRLGERNSTLRVVSDQIGSPTYTVDLVPVLMEILNSENYGIYHVTNEGVCSWAAFAEEIVKQCHFNTAIQSVTSEEYGAKAVRPKNSRLSKGKLVKSGYRPLPDWKDALRRFLAEKNCKERM